MMCRVLSGFIAGIVVLSYSGVAHAVCESALVLATYQSTTDIRSDWRLAEQVDSSTWEKIMHNSGANATIYGVPVGVSYQDFKNRIEALKQSHNESLSTSQFVNVATTALDPKSPSVYRDCILNEVFHENGLHAAIVSSTKSDISILVKWFVPGQASAAQVKWDPDTVGGKKVDNKIPQGMQTLRVLRPKNQIALVGNYNGYTTGSIVLEPVPPPPKPVTTSVAERLSRGDKFTVKFNVPSDYICGIPWNAPGNLLGNVRGRDGVYVGWYVPATRSW